MLPISGVSSEGREIFSMIGGHLDSLAFRLKTTAKFGSWSLLFKDSDRSRAIAWGPCLNDGEVIIPNMFIIDSVLKIWIDNFFIAEDSENNLLKVKLTDKNTHKLCIFVDDKRRFVLTAAYPGTKVLYKEKIYERKQDGWYADGSLLYQKTTADVNFSEPPINSSSVVIPEGQFADAAGKGTFTNDGEGVRKFIQDARVVSKGENTTKVGRGNKRWYYGKLYTVIYDHLSRQINGGTTERTHAEMKCASRGESVGRC
jgi:hypothetical protein